MSKKTYDSITLSVLWSRLLAIVDEAGTTLQRTSFSTITRESNDFAVVLMDKKGRSIAQSAISVPSFLGVIPMMTKHLLHSEFPEDSWKQGDVVTTNDPQLCAGHKPDVGVVSPIFYNENLIGFMGTISHVPDIGGVLWGAGARDAYEEGLLIPPTKLYSEGVENDTLINLIRRNVRAPKQTVGDIRAQVAANDQGKKGLIALMKETGLDSIDNLAEQIIVTSEKAMREALMEAPDGTYRYSYDADGDCGDEPVRIECAVTISGDEITVDYEGTTGAHSLGINSVLNYTYAYTAYPIKCVFSPEVPNNDGAFRPIKVTAPKGSLLNATEFVPVGARNMTGNMLHAPVFGALVQAVPDKVQADCGAPCWCVVLNGYNPDKNDMEFVEYFFLNGGGGARPDRDGEGILSFPTNISNVPLELQEMSAPILYHRKKLIPNSAGLGQFRGGLGQQITFEVISEGGLNMSLLTEKLNNVSRGMRDGKDSAKGELIIEPEKQIPPKGIVRLKKGDKITMKMPGGGGYGNPKHRDLAARERDLLNGYISEE
jgi:N-methylhydantoinase B|tara:strand:+ start:13578 stop:15206 length:1629 start_codon:yes stop_codon:yes gene_type:complete